MPIVHVMSHGTNEMKIPQNSPCTSNVYSTSHSGLTKIGHLQLVVQSRMMTTTTTTTSFTFSFCLTRLFIQNRVGRVPTGLPFWRTVDARFFTGQMPLLSPNQQCLESRLTENDAGKAASAIATTERQLHTHERQ